MGMLGQPQGSMPFINQPVITVTKIPMITLQLPYIGVNSDVEPEPIDIKAAINQHVWLNENKTIVPKEQTIIHSREVLIFYVNRRIQQVRMKSYTNPIAFAQLPLSMTNLERINKYPVNVPDTISLTSTGRDDVYELRSVVAITETSIKPCPKTMEMTSLITGCIGLIKVPNTNSAYTKPVLRYDPFGASIPVEDSTIPGKYIENQPVTLIDEYFTSFDKDDVDESFCTLRSRNGTIFIYAKSCEAGGSYTCAEFINIA